MSSDLSYRLSLLLFGLMFSCNLSLGHFLSRPTGRFGVTMGRGDGVGCGLGLKYALIVAAIVSKVEELAVSEVTRVGCEISLK